MHQSPTRHFLPSEPLAFDWEPDLARLREEAHEVRRTGRADLWAAVEAECWIDLIDAEIAALEARAGDQSGNAEALRRLRHWRAELLLLARRFQSCGNAQQFAADRPFAEQSQGSEAS